MDLRIGCGSTSVADNPNALQSRPSWVHTVVAPNPYRGHPRGTDASRYGPEAAAARLVELAQRHEITGAVHGSGLYLGVELVRDRTTLEPATSEAGAICDRMLDLGVVIQPTSDWMNVFKVKPPLCIERSAADFFVDTLDRVLSEGW